MRDPAFLFYDGDAAKDVSHMNRLERGCYFDLIQAQRKFGRMSLDLIKKILGREFDTCWESVKICLTYDNHMYFIEWLEESTIKRKEYSESRKRNKMGHKKKHMTNICKTYDEHMENEIVNEDENELVLSLWNNFAEKHNLGKVIKLSDKRKSAISARKKEIEFDLVKILSLISESEFLKGNNQQGWKVDFDFVFCSKNNYLKILEGKYNGKPKGNGVYQQHITEDKLRGIADDIFNDPDLIR